MALNPVRTIRMPIYAIVCIVGFIIAATITLSWPRTDSLGTALQPVLNEPGGDRFQIAKAILKNYEETRANAARWSGVYWGFKRNLAIVGNVDKAQSDPKVSIN
ncbi:hypothetical protein HV337_05700 [Citrobacter freundii]|uniref:hypothetical protein n=1 Tax=Citrobacter freundii TaxID=546 RepID=UPI00129CEBD3|nr:hypothetical protein [Citrobacter freundii]QLR72073.1 hypothetical protein HV337_05700 [Citrobacter freundii]QLY51271.1 hypothetical protein HV186_05655 [Citrobacter freundii]